MAISHSAVDQAGCPVLYFLKPLRLLQRLSISSLLVTNAWTIGSVAAAVRYRLILEMLRRWNMADLHATVTWDSIVISATNCTPIVRTQSVTLTTQSPKRNDCSVNFFSYWAEPYTITSVFVSFNFNELVFIQLLTSVTHCSMLSTAASVSSWWGFTVM